MIITFCNNWVRDRKQGLLHGADLRCANLRDADLRDADLCFANLRDADLRGANLYDADLYDADLRGANLRHANLRHADLRGANLRGADLCGADLCDANLNHVDLSGCKPDGNTIKHIDTETYRVLRTPHTIQIGCENHTIDEWKNFTDCEILKMDGSRALIFWKKYKTEVTK